LSGGFLSSYIQSSFIIQKPNISQHLHMYTETELIHEPTCGWYRNVQHHPLRFMNPSSSENERNQSDSSTIRHAKLDSDELEGYPTVARWCAKG